MFDWLEFYKAGGRSTQKITRPIKFNVDKVNDNATFPMLILNKSTLLEAINFLLNILQIIDNVVITLNIKELSYFSPKNLWNRKYFILDIISKLGSIFWSLVSNKVLDLMSKGNGKTFFMLDDVKFVVIFSEFTLCWISFLFGKFQ